MSYNPPNARRGFLSLLWISVVVALVCGVAIDGSVALANPLWVTVNGIGNALLGVLFVAFFALPICFICGAILAPVAPPLFSRLGLANLQGYIFGGAICGGLTLTLLALLTIGSVPHLLGQLGLGLLPGAVAGCLWWLAVEQPQMRIEQNG